MQRDQCLLQYNAFKQGSYVKAQNNYNTQMTATDKGKNTPNDGINCQINKM